MPAPAAAAPPVGDGREQLLFESDVESMPSLCANSDTESACDSEYCPDDADLVQPKPTFSLEHTMAEDPAVVRLARFDEPCLPKARGPYSLKRFREADSRPANIEALVPAAAWAQVSRPPPPPRRAATSPLREGAIVTSAR